MDGVELYGRADQSLRAAVTTDAAVYPVEEGRAAAVEVTVATTGAAPLDDPVTVAYETAATGTAEPGKDYTPVTGTVTFPAGTPQAPPARSPSVRSRTRRPSPPRPSRSG